jgi:hypothetical protein
MPASSDQAQHQRHEALQAELGSVTEIASIILAQKTEQEAASRTVDIDRFAYPRRRS